MTTVSAKRKCQSWIARFVEHTDNLEAAPLWRKWAAISTIAATLEQKVWVEVSSRLYPNLYILLVGDAGLGKTRTIMAARGLAEELPDMLMAPTSMTMASLVDHLVESKRSWAESLGVTREYHTLYITADELSAFMHEYSGDLIAGLTTFYDCVPYSQSRRTTDIRIKIRSPQINMLAGTTPSNLLRFIPEAAWEQGFTSRVIMIYSSEKPIIDVFKVGPKKKAEDLIHDINIIDKLRGKFHWTEGFGRAMHQFKEDTYAETSTIPVPDHPKLKHYLSRRFSHLLKLSMIAVVDQRNDLILTEEAFNIAMGWLVEAEFFMPDIFRGGTGSGDSKALDEIKHFVVKAGPKGIEENFVVRFALRHVERSYNVINMIDLLIRSGDIRVTSINVRTGLRTFVATNFTVVNLPVGKPSEEDPSGSKTG